MSSNILIIILSQQGYWFGGDSGTIRVQWPTEHAPVESVLVWKLVLGEASMAEGRLPLAGDSRASELSLAVPDVRVRTSLRWLYSVRGRDGDKELASGEAAIEVLPKNLLAGVGRRLEGKKLLVWDEAGRLAKTLSENAIEHRCVRSSTDLQAAKADMILVAPDQLDGSPFAQTTLLGHAEAGAGVFLFSQPRVKLLAGYSVTPREVPPELNWRATHPLLNRFRAEDLPSLTQGAKGLSAVQLPPDEPALEIAWWPAESDSPEPAPIDALLVSKTLGNGRVVLCQLPLGPWDRDPRAQVLLRSALDYLGTRPEPTPPPSRRRMEPPQLATSVPTVTIPPGGRP